MIELQKMTPDVYYNQSRDFQFIGRLYDLILNYSKSNSDQLYNLPLSMNSNEKLIDLMTMTLGFKSRHNYNIKQLTALCSAFAEVIRNKGNIKSIETACSTLFHAEGIAGTVYTDFNKDSSGNDILTELNIYIPEKLSDINLLKDLLNYILPAGMSANIIKMTIVQVPTAETALKYTGTVKVSAGNAEKFSNIISAGDTNGKYAGTSDGYFVNTTVDATSENKKELTPDANIETLYPTTTSNGEGN